MDQYSNSIISVVFGVLAIWLFRGVYTTRGKMVIKDRQWTVQRIIFIVAGVMILLTGLLYTSLLDWLRLIIMLLCIVAFLLSRDGIGHQGVCSTGRYIPYTEIRNYDYDEKKNKFVVYFTAMDKGKNANDYNLSIDFDLKDAEAVKKLLKTHIGKKYIRMKKGK